MQFSSFVFAVRSFVICGPVHHARHRPALRLYTGLLSVRGTAPSRRAFGVTKALSMVDHFPSTTFSRESSVVERRRRARSSGMERTCLDSSASHALVRPMHFRSPLYLLSVRRHDHCFPSAVALSLPICSLHSLIVYPPSPPNPRPFSRIYSPSLPCLLLCPHSFNR